MKNRVSSNLIFTIFSFLLLVTPISIAQVPDPAYNPMTAPGAQGISLNGHILNWKNSNGTTYNEVYFSDDSLLVANMDTSVRVRNGYPSTVYNSFPLTQYGALQWYSKYFWRVVEFNSSGSSSSELWNFTSVQAYILGYDYSFDNGLDGWQIIGPLGMSNWYWSNTTHTNSQSGEIVFRWDPVFIGDSYVMSPELAAPAGAVLAFVFSFYEDWWSDTVEVGCGITTDNGSTWSTIWDLHASGNVGPDLVNMEFETPGNFRIGFYYTGNSNNIDFFYVDNIIMGTALTPATPPHLLQVNASDSTAKVMVNWEAGGAPSGLYGYTLQRKSGLPSSNNPFITVATTDLGPRIFEDYDVEPNQSYTYRVRSLIIGADSHYGNEATAYVPAIVPVELVSFNANVFDAGVSLNWRTATETNNRGFEVERRILGSRQYAVGNEEWKLIGFVDGKGTTTATQSYSFVDEEVTSGKYQYRLKQIDFDGSFEYSNVVEVDVNLVSEFSLEQNYPNPFNPTTKISWQSPIAGHQTIKVFDVLGNEVATLVDEFRETGRYEIEFDANNLSSGIYYYRLISGDFITTKKMLMLK